MSINQQPSKYMQTNTTGTISSGRGVLQRIIVSSTSSGTIKIYDNTAASGTVILETFTPTAGQTLDFDNLLFTNGLHIVVANTIEFTVVYTDI